ncbi:MAG: sulfotransferase, partial [Gemmatimonadetes bacterium]|nr:sulfotransferase [Gemmatimonadota bacterium]
MNSVDPRRILVMGCSRSGTTLLQSLFASHSGVHTFPETGLFLKAFGMRGWVLPWARLGLSLGKERGALARLLPSTGGATGPLPSLPPYHPRLSRSLEASADFLDGLAAANGKKAWVEKTPRHVFHARRIGRVVPGVSCVHIIRRGEDVVASIVDRAKRYPDRFPRQADPGYGIRQWN